MAIATIHIYKLLLYQRFRLGVEIEWKVNGNFCIIAFAKYHEQYLINSKALIFLSFVLQALCDATGEQNTTLHDFSRFKTMSGV